MTVTARPIKPGPENAASVPAPSPDPLIVPIVLADLAATDELAARIARLARSGDLILLQGGLGSGKTAFARGFLRALGVREEVPSPTFTLVQAYETDKGPVWHFDLYRLQQPEEAVELGFDEARANGIVLVEWPDRLGPHVPEDALTLTLAIAGPTQRSVTLSGSGEWRMRLAPAGLT
jgi:tRNA threonylcarbamoyladenosine biosynthesis protein TsaE